MSPETIRESALPLAFLLLTAGICLGEKGEAVQAGMHASACLAGSWVLALVRFRGFRCRRLPGTLSRPPSILFASMLVFTCGLALGGLDRNRDDSFAVCAGTMVSVVVDIERLERRDWMEVSARASIVEGRGPSGSRSGAGRGLILIRCMQSEGDGADGSCLAIRQGHRVAVHGRATWSVDRGSSLLVSGGVRPVFARGRTAGPAAWLDQFRSVASFRCMRNVEGPASWLAPALVLGEGRGVPASARSALSILGTAHVLSVSGLHVAAAAAACGAFVFFVLGFPASRLCPGLNVAAAATASTVLSAWLVAAVAGFPPSAIRSAGIATSWVISRFLRRRPPSMVVVSGVGIVELLLRPFDAVSISFQLSYAAVSGIILSAGIFDRLPNRKGPTGFVARWIAGGLAMSVGATVATVPLTLAYFGSAPLAGPVANLLVVPAFTFVALPGAFLTVILAWAGCLPWQGVGGIVMGLYGRAAGILIWIQEEAARRIPWWMAYPPFPVDATAAAAASFLLAFVAFGGRSRSVWPGLLAAALTIGLFQWHGPPEGIVTFLDVGKGDAALIRCPSGERWLVDAGAPSGGRGTLLKALARNGVRDIDGVVLTHAHDDHYGGIAELLGTLGPFEIAASPVTIQSAGQAIGEMVARGGTLRELRHGGPVIPGCGAETSIVAMDMAETALQGENSGQSKNVNDDSLVFLLSFAGRRILFVGDLEAEGEKILIKSGRELGADILKAGHHGSPGATSQDFLKLVRPNAVVVTGWPNGPRKGPKDDFLIRFSQSESIVMATTLVGDVTVDIIDTGQGKIGFEPVLKPRNAFPDGFGGRDALARSILRPVPGTENP